MNEISKSFYPRDIFEFHSSPNRYHLGSNIASPNVWTSTKLWSHTIYRCYTFMHCYNTFIPPTFLPTLGIGKVMVLGKLPHIKKNNMNKPKQNTIGTSLSRRRTVWTTWGAAESTIMHHMWRLLFLCFRDPSRTSAFRCQGYHCSAIIGGCTSWENPQLQCFNITL